MTTIDPLQAWKRSSFSTGSRNVAEAIGQALTRGGHTASMEVLFTGVDHKGRRKRECIVYTNLAPAQLNELLAVIVDAVKQ